MIRRLIFPVLAAALSINLPTPADACSETPGYLKPSNFELVRDTEAIVLARAVRTVKKGDRVTHMGFEILQVLKGTVADKTLTLLGHDAWFGPSDPHNFSEVRPGAGKAGSIAEDYKLEATFILFLGRKGRNWRVSGPGLTRVNEEVEGMDAPWAKAVTQYIRISALKTVDLQKDALRKLAAESDPIPGLAADIARHFREPHGSKTFEDLQELYDHAADDSARVRVLWAFANGKHAPATELFRRLIKSGDWKRFALPLADFVANMRDSSVVEMVVRTPGQLLRRNKIGRLRR